MEVVTFKDSAVPLRVGSIRGAVALRICFLLVMRAVWHQSTVPKASIKRGSADLPADDRHSWRPLPLIWSTFGLLETTRGKRGDMPYDG